MLDTLSSPGLVSLGSRATVDAGLSRFPPISNGLHASVSIVFTCVYKVTCKGFERETVVNLALN